MGRALRRVDALLYHAECMIAWVASLGIVTLMFISVVHRVFERPEGRLSTALLWLFSRLGVDAAPEVVHGPVSLGLNLVLTFGLVLLARRTMTRRTPAGWGRDAAVAAGWTVVLATVVWGMLTVLPNGLPWAVKGCLALVILMGFLGASMATYERRHLTVEIGEKIWPASVAPAVRRLAAAVTAAFCLLIAFFAFVSVRAYYLQWSEHPLTALLDESLEVPKWVALAVIPHAFAMIGLRFLGQAVDDSRDTPEDLP
ncbi:TRAP transporter small permease [Myxococcota bacterium]|nr:TRAP transporter small permease [Myxococcota bacterium]